MVKDMNRTKYKAILEFFNSVARIINEPKLAKDFCAIYECQLAAVIRALKLNDSFDISSYHEDDPFKMAKEMFQSNDFGINFLLQIDPIDGKKSDQIKIGKLLIGIIYLLKALKPELYKAALQQVDKSQNFDHEIEHIIVFLETKEQWPGDGWPNILNIAAPLDFDDRVKPLPSFISSSGIPRTPARRSFRQQTMSPYKKVFNDSPITKTKDKETKRKITLLENQVLQLRFDYNDLGQKYDEILEENKKYKEENQKLKNSNENTRIQLQDYHEISAELKQVKSDKEDLQKEIKSIKDTNRELADDLKSCYIALEASSSDLNEKQYQIELLEKTNASITQQIADFRDELIEARNDRDIFQKQFFETKTTLDRLLRDYDIMKMQNSEMSRMSLSVTDLGNINLTDENERLRDQITEMSRKFEDERDESHVQLQKQIALLNSEIERLNLKLTDIVKENEKRKIEIETFKMDLSERNAQILQYRSEIAELNGKFQCLKELADEWKDKYDVTHKELLTIQEDKNALIKKQRSLEGTVNTQENKITLYERRELGSLARKLFYENLSIKDRMSISSDEELPWMKSKKPTYQPPEKLYFNRSK